MRSAFAASPASITSNGILVAITVGLKKSVFTVSLFLLYKLSLHYMLLDQHAVCFSTEGAFRHSRFCYLWS